MPRYYFHLINGEDRLLDPEGSEVADETVAQRTLASARDLIAADARSGVIDLRYRLEVHDQAGTVVHQLAFPDAVDVLRA